MTSGHEENAGHAPSGKEHRMRIIKVFLILTAITAAEFLIAFSVDRGIIRNLVFIIMTLAKAFYIVAEFMHLKHEVKRFAYTILFPMLFVAWLILALLIEGNFIFYGWLGDGNISNP